MFVRLFGGVMTNFGLKLRNFFGVVRGKYYFCILYDVFDKL